MKPDQIKQTIVTLAEQQGRSLRDLSLAIGKNHAYLFQYVNHSKPSRLSEEARERLAIELGVDEALLKAGGLKGPSQEKRPSSGKLPIFGRTDHLGVLHMSEDPNEYVDCPPYLLEIKSGFGVFMHDETMAPRYEPGDLLYIDPTKPPAPGCDILIEDNDGRLKMRRLKSRKENGDLTLVKFNPPGQETLPASRIKHVRRIVGSRHR